MTLARAVEAALEGDTATGGDRLVLRDGMVGWNARALLSTIDRVAEELRALELPRDEPVAVLLPSGAPLIATLLAAGEVPLTPVVLDPCWDDAMLGEVVSRLQPVGILTDRSGMDRLGRGLPVPATGRSALPVDMAIELRLSGLPSEPNPPERFPRPTATVRALAEIDAAPPGARTRAPAGPSPHMVLMTSGSTGPPKGVRRTHRSWLRSFEATRRMGPDPADRIVVPGSLASSWFLYAAIEGLCAGAAVRVWDRADPAAIVDELDDWRATRVAVVPTLLERCVASAGHRDVELPALRHIVSCGGSWPNGLRDRTVAIAPHTRVHDVYGAAEWSVVSVREVERGSHQADLGRPVPGVDISVRDDHGRTVPDGEAGVLWVRSPLTFEGYVGGGDPDRVGGREPSAIRTVAHPAAAIDDLTRDTMLGDAATWDAEGFVAVGDIARYLDGRLSLVGRRDDTIVCRGSKVHPELVERALGRSDGVTDVAVTLATDPRRGEHLVALLQGAVSATRGELRVHARRHLPRASRPARFLLVPHLPRTPAGKLDRERLPALIPLGRPVPTGLMPAEGRTAR